jgi:hypothetical protein
MKVMGGWDKGMMEGFRRVTIMSGYVYDYTRAPEQHS